MSDQARAYGFAAAAVLFWSTVASAFKLSLRHLTPVELLFYASCVSSCVLLVTLALRKKLHLLREAGWGGWGRAMIRGLLSPFLYYLVLFKAYDLLPGPAGAAAQLHLGGDAFAAVGSVAGPPAEDVGVRRHVGQLCRGVGDFDGWRGAGA